MTIIDLRTERVQREVLDIVRAFSEDACKARSLRQFSRWYEGTHKLVRAYLRIKAVPAPSLDFRRYYVTIANIVIAENLRGCGGFKLLADTLQEYACRWRMGFMVECVVNDLLAEHLMNDKAYARYPTHQDTFYVPALEGNNIHL